MSHFLHLGRSIAAHPRRHEIDSKTWKFWYSVMLRNPCMDLRGAELKTHSPSNSDTCLLIYMFLFIKNVDHCLMPPRRLQRHTIWSRKRIALHVASHSATNEGRYQQERLLQSIRDRSVAPWSHQDSHL